MTPLEALNHWAPIAWLRTDPLVYPILEVIHIVALAIVFGSLWIVDLRLLGWMRKLDVKELTSAVLPWTLGAFSFAALSGLLMFVSRISDFISNPMFIAKICLLFAAATNAAVLHARGPLDERSALTRLQALLSIGIWIAVIFCARFIAYA